MGDAARELTERYDRAAAAYRDMWAPILRTAALPLARELAASEIARVLDVGTGVGALLPDLAGIFPNAVIAGVDRSRGMLALAPQRYERSLMDARQLAIRSGVMDRLLLVFMLFHLEEPVVALREARRVLKPGGKVGTLTWAGEMQSEANRVWLECLDEYGAIPPDPAAETRHETVDSPAKMEALLRGAGFESPRCWEDDLVSDLDAEHLIRLKTSVGAAQSRFESLGAVAGAVCIEEARRRMKALTADDFALRGRVVYAIARS